MKLKDIATGAGVSHQAVYKRLKAKGISPETITDKETGELTAAGLAIMLELYPQKRDEQPAETTCQPTQPPAALETLRGEIERLRNELSKAKGQIEALTDERDFLRKMLEQSQDMAAMRTRIDALEAGQKAAQAQALTDGKPRRRLWDRIRGRKEADA